MGRGAIWPPIVEAAAGRKAVAARVALAGAVIRFAVMAKVHARIPRDGTLVVGGGRRLVLGRAR